MIKIEVYGDAPMYVTREQLFMLFQIGSMIHWSKDQNCFATYAGVSHRMIARIMSELGELLPLPPTES